MELSTHHPGALDDRYGRYYATIFILHRIAPSMCWTLTFKTQMRNDIIRRFEDEGWPGPKVYRNYYPSFSSRCEAACFYRLMYLLCKYGNINKKVAPDEVREFLRDMWQMSTDNCERRGEHRSPWPPLKYKRFFESVHICIDPVYSDSEMKAGGATVGEYNMPFGPWGLQPEAPRTRRRILGADLCKTRRKDLQQNIRSIL